jgi:glycosyltransferase involved in cell wall biosynthesis
VDNGSTDGSDIIAADHGATVLRESERGYGAACLKGIDYLKRTSQPQILVFLDGDYSDYPEDMIQLIEKINEGYDFVLGSRVLGVASGIAKLSSHSILGNKLAGFFLKWLFRGNYTDLGPFRAIRFDKLIQLNMADRNYGWTMEMQIKAVRHHLKILEIPVRYRERFGGESKVTGTFTGSVKAFSKITLIVILYFFRIRR